MRERSLSSSFKLKNARSWVRNLLLDNCELIKQLFNN